ncbi:hypothetical protein QBC39DRAFT_366438 [Podospora conica]|nr:hypothetical protein QBC39DRAFT_366438 [Schizothecium conicum]
MSYLRSIKHSPSLMYSLSLRLIVLSFGDADQSTLPGSWSNRLEVCGSEFRRSIWCVLFNEPTYPIELWVL